jgi:hypothetical protein
MRDDVAAALLRRVALRMSTTMMTMIPLHLKSKEKLR